MSSADARAPQSEALLSPETMSALGLRRQPFAGLAADGDAYTDETTAEQLADIRQALITGDDLLLILGPEGAGRSTLLSQLAANSGQRIQCFSVQGGPRFSTHNLFSGVLEAFRQRPPDELREVLDALVPHLQRMAGDNVLCTVVLDDADRVAEAELTRLLSGMLYLNSRDETLLRIALSAEEAFEERIPELLPEGADLPYSGLVIEPLGPDRAGAYLDFRLNQAGRFDAFPFSEREIEAMTSRAGGRPRALHAEAAAELESRHAGVDPDEDLPPELAEHGRERRGARAGAGPFGGGALGRLLGARAGKLALGSLALALILGGLLLSRPAPEGEEPSYRVVDDGPIDGTGAGSVDAETEVADASGPAPEPADGTGARADAAPDAGASRPSGTDDGRGVPIVTEPLAETRSEPTPAPAPDDGPAEDARDAGGGAGGATASVPTAPAEPPAPEPLPEPAPAREVALAEPEPEPEPVPEPEPAVAPAPETPSTTALPPAAALPPADGGPETLESPNWVLVQDPERFTVQMSASTERDAVEAFLERTGLAAPNSIFAFDRDGTTWYALVHGLYDSVEEARLAIERMPSEAQTNQPWIRGIGRIQAALKAQ